MGLKKNFCCGTWATAWSHEPNSAAGKKVEGLGMKDKQEKHLKNLSIHNTKNYFFYQELNFSNYVWAAVCVETSCIHSLIQKPQTGQTVTMDPTQLDRQ